MERKREQNQILRVLLDCLPKSQSPHRRTTQCEPLGGRRFGKRTQAKSSQQGERSKVESPRWPASAQPSCPGTRRLLQVRGLRAAGTPGEPSNRRRGKSDVAGLSMNPEEKNGAPQGDKPCNDSCLTEFAQDLRRNERKAVRERGGFHQTPPSPSRDERFIRGPEDRLDSRCN